MSVISEIFIVVSVFSVFLTDRLVQSEEKGRFPDTYSVCACPMQYEPVCASDGKTYSNYCDLACTQKFVPGVLALCHTECPCYPTLVDNSNLTTQPLVRSYLYEDEFQRSCNCPRIWKPVCGSDGVTYSNECMLECEHAKDSNIVKLFDGECYA